MARVRAQDVRSRMLDLIWGHQVKHGQGRYCWRCTRFGYGDARRNGGQERGDGK